MLRYFLKKDVIFSLLGSGFPEIKSDFSISIIEEVSRKIGYTLNIYFEWPSDDEFIKISIEQDRNVIDKYDTLTKAMGFLFFSNKHLKPEKTKDSIQSLIMHDDTNIADLILTMREYNIDQSRYKLVQTKKLTIGLIADLTKSELVHLNMINDFVIEFKDAPYEDFFYAA